MKVGDKVRRPDGVVGTVTRAYTYDGEPRHTPWWNRRMLDFDWGGASGQTKGWVEKNVQERLYDGMWKRVGR